MRRAERVMEKGSVLIRLKREMSHEGWSYLNGGVELMLVRSCDPHVVYTRNNIERRISLE